MVHNSPLFRNFAAKLSGMAGQSLKEKTANALMWGALNTLLTQLLSIFIGIFLARLLTPADYGLVGLLAIFSAIANSLQESGFIAAITNLKQVEHKDYNAVFWFSTMVSLMLYTVLFFLSPLIARFFHQPALIPLSRLVFASFVLAGIGTAHAAYMFRNMMNRERATINLFTLIGSGTIGILLAFNGYSYWSLAWQQFAYIALFNIGRCYYVRWRPTLTFDFTPIRRMFGFSSKILITNIATQVNNNVLTFIFGRMFSTTVVGNYTQAAKWNTMAAQLISGTLQQVAQPTMVSIESEEDRQVNVFRKMLRFTAMFSMPLLLGLASVSTQFIEVLIGHQWADSAVLLKILCVSGAFLPIHTLYQNLFISHSHSATYMWSSIALIAAQVTVVLVFGQWGVETMVTAYTVILILWTMVWQQLARRLIRLRNKDIILDILPFLLASIGSIAVAHACTFMLSGNILLLCLRTIITAACYVTVLKIAHAKIFEECIAFFTSKISHNKYTK